MEQGRSARRQSLKNFNNTYNVNKYLNTCARNLGLNASNNNKARAKTNQRNTLANALRSCAWRKMSLRYNPPTGGARRTHRKRRASRMTRRR